MRVLSALGIRLTGRPSGERVFYQAHVGTIGWQREVPEGGLAGVTGRWVGIQAMRIRLSP